MAYGDKAFRFSRLWISPIFLTLTRARGYGLERIPTTGGCVVAINHLMWIDVPIVGALSKRNLNFVAKSELMGIPVAGRYIRWHGVVAVRRGESDRDAVRLMRQAARDGRALALFVEGTRQLSGEPGKAHPGAAMVALQEGVPVVPVAIYGTQFWRHRKFRACSIAVGEPIRFDDLPKNGSGYKQATAEIERRIRVLFDWLAEVDARGRPAGEIPPL
jgi:1-acyl-sn-glycerol-3-phosphate acyltransferase